MNTSFLSSEYDFTKTVKILLQTIEEQVIKEQRIIYVKRLYEYLILDNHWLTTVKHSTFRHVVCDKLHEIKNSGISYEDLQYFSDVQRRLHFGNFCKGITVKNKLCINKVSKCSELCHIHKKRYEKLLDCIVNNTNIIKDVADIIVRIVIFYLFPLN